MALHITSKTRPLYVPERTYQRPTSRDELKELIRQELRRQGPDADLNHIDVSEITDMSWLFCYFGIRNIKIESWDVSNVQTMEYMFYGCDNFTGVGLDNWNTSNVTNMSYMFRDCDAIVKPPRWYTDFVDLDHNSGNDSKDEFYWAMTTLALFFIGAIVIPIIAYIVFEK